MWTWRCVFFFFKQKTAYEMRISDWSSDVCSSDLHVAATGESEGYYIDYVKDTAAGLARALAEGFIFQGEASLFWDGAPRGERSTGQPPTAFVNLDRKSVV